MGYIKEPKGIDFTVIPRTKPDIEADRMLSEIIRADKLKRTAKNSKKKASKETSQQ
ncbi:MAG: hypothetical protein Q8R96_11575 [Bacteroidota bacterium]|nr:hypothetical protein [Bacteroidota bacterium]